MKAIATLGCLLLTAKLGGDLAVMIGLPVVLGKPLISVVLVNLMPIGLTELDAIKTDVFIDMLARVEVLHLLLEVGLESKVDQMLNVSWSAPLVATLGVLGRGVDRRSVGIGMVPRGEVGHTFVHIGLAPSTSDRRIVDEATDFAVVVMVVVTTMVTPPALKWSLGREQ